MVSVSGCASILKGKSEDVRFRSEPEKAQIWLNGEYYGDTPVTL